jgi:hypothetical protein
MLTNQQVFDNALFGIRKQEYKQSVHSDGHSKCLYRGPGGRRCGVGHSIPDEVFYQPGRPALDDRSATSILSLLENDQFVSDVFKGIDRDLLADLQSAHDSTLKRGPKAFEEKMAEIAGEHNLKYTPASL